MVNQISSTPLTSLRHIFIPNCVTSLTGIVTKADAIDRLVDVMVSVGRLPKEGKPIVTRALLEREQFGTTGMGKGLAMPHLRSRQVDEFAGAIGVANEGMDFDSLDGLPTHLVILMISPFEERAMHCEVMGRVASLLSNRTLLYSLRLPRSPKSLLSFLGF